ncbi:LysR family transcriptional regulator [Paraglaciecola polaris]|uniref:Transcriptional regulator, LysR family n=1 Tax=Paraglaciecola polaris LMG 21857 TaxID=1129793 RepID=K7AH82_9ALTE|nr:LysR family transcriptional regulator [Paraglaciecola polaris]GAC34620.1 transcriptional regulator, LysR family [Paraglaciecola polaris LMG 21857]
MINTVWLKTFCTLADLGHFTQTAHALFMTQSGVSQQIKKLEQQLATPLLIRVGKSFTLTDAGVALHRDGRKLLQATELLEQNIKQDDPHSGRVRIATPGSVGLTLYPFLLDLQQQHPKLSVMHSFAPNKSIERDVSQRHFDLGITTQPSTLPDVFTQAIAQEALVLVTDNRIADINWPVLQRLGFISHPDGHHHCQALLRANFLQFEHPEQFQERGFSNQISLILEPVSRGFGFSVLPLHAAKAFAKQAKIRIHTLAHPVSETLYLCRHTQVSQSQRVRYVADKIQTLLQAKV